LKHIILKLLDVTSELKVKSLIFIDCNYTASLGLCFYNRGQELEELDGIVKPGKLVIVWGPRGVGKSELVRYWLRRRRRSGFIEVDARRIAIRGLIESMGFEGIDVNMINPIRDAILEVLNVKSSVTKLVAVVYSRFKRIVIGVPAIFIDEFHILHAGNGYSESIKNSRLYQDS